MPSPRDTSTRLAHIEEILAQTAPGATAGAADATAVHLNSVSIERIRRLTAALGDLPLEQGPDVVDAVLMRLLLDEFMTSVFHLRAVARTAVSRVDAATTPLRDARRAMHRLEKTAATPTANWLHKK